MSGRMGSGASLILDGIKPKSPKKDSQADVKNVGPMSVEVKHDEVIPVEPHNVNVLSEKHINVNVLQEAVNLALDKKQRISVWAPDIALILWYLKLSTPMFSISDVAKKYITEGLKRDYPELYKQATEALERKRG